ncbi:hypothetical protein, partial [Streptomyces lydicus]|uniref:hypothetical protein n=1 Tax=Streptomyces lydicus TaxID=47763 RepID=UPI003D9ED538
MGATPREYQRAGALIETAVSVCAPVRSPCAPRPYRAACRSTTEPPMEKPTVAIRRWPGARAQRAAAARSAP